MVGGMGIPDTPPPRDNVVSLDAHRAARRHLVRVSTVDRMLLAHLAAPSRRLTLCGVTPSASSGPLRYSHPSAAACPACDTRLREGHQR